MTGHPFGNGAPVSNGQATKARRMQVILSRKIDSIAQVLGITFDAKGNLVQEGYSSHTHAESGGGETHGVS